jgi:deoxyribonuclease-4
MMPMVALAAEPAGARVDSQPIRRIGPHLPLGGGMLKAAERAVGIGATVVQVFTDNPTAWRRRSKLPEELPAFRARLARAGIGPVSVHAPYLVNLCGPNDEFWNASVEMMADELRVGAAYGAAFVVMHIGSHRGTGREAGIARLVRGLSAVLDEAGQQPLENGDGWPRLVLENAAGSGDGIGASIEDLVDVFEAMAAHGLPLDRFGVCLDTAHLWGAGYDIGSRAGVTRLVRDIDRRLGRDKVLMVHLNDSRTTLASRLDRHEHIAGGQLGERGMRAVLGDPWLSTLPTYLETPGMDSGYDLINLDRVRILAAGGRLPALPPEAFHLHGSRTRTAPPQR